VAGPHAKREAREVIFAELEAEAPELMRGEIEVVESYFGGHHKGKRGRGAAGKVAVFRLLKRQKKVHVVIIPDARSDTLIPIIRQKIRPDSIVYTDTFKSHDVLDVSEFKHLRINHSVLFADQHSHINGIENFWNQAKCHLRSYNGIAEHHFPLFIKECEWCFNYRPVSNTHQTLTR
jgi:transposase